MWRFTFKIYLVLIGCAVIGYSTRLSAQSYIIKTIAGTGVAGYSGNGGPATLATLSAPYGITLDKFGNLFFTDNNCVRKIDTLGIITTVAGTGIAGYSGNGGPATNAQLSNPTDIAIDGYGNLFVADMNYYLRKIDTQGIIYSIAGNGIQGASGDGGMCDTAEFSAYGIAIDSLETIYFADAMDNRIRYIRTDGIINTLAGNGTSGFDSDTCMADTASLSAPNAITYCNTGYFLVADCDNNCIRKIDTASRIFTIAGTGSSYGGFSGDGHRADSALLFFPWDVKTDTQGNIFIDDLGNNLIRRIDHSSNIITTIAGSFHWISYSYGGDGICATNAYISPQRLAIDRSGNIYFTDYNNNQIRELIKDNPPVFTHGDNLYQYICMGDTLFLDSFLTAIDPDTAQMNIWSISRNPTHGVIVGAFEMMSSGIPMTPDNFFYVPNPGFAGIDTCVCKVKDAIGGIDTIRIVIAVGINNTASIIGASSVCVGASVSLFDSTTGGAWHVTNNHLLDSVNIFKGVSAGTDTVFYSVTNQCGITFDTFKILSVLPLPESGTIVGPSNLCAGIPVSYVDSGALGSVEWLCDCPPSVIRSTDTIIGYDSCIALVYVWVENECGVTATHIQVTVNPIPQVQSIFGLDSVCVGSTISMTDTGSIGIGLWILSNDNASLLGSNITGINFGIDTLRYVVSNYCGADTSTKPIYIKSLPDAGVIIGTDSACVGNIVTFYESAGGGIWQTVGSVVTISDSGNAFSSEAGTFNIKYIVSNSCGVDSAIKSVTFISAPYAAPLLFPDSVCVADTFTIVDSVTTGVWIAANHTVTIDATGFVAANVPGLDTIYYVVNNYCGSDTARKTIFIKALPYAGPITAPDSICLNATATLVDSISGGLWFTHSVGINLAGDTLKALAIGTDTIHYVVSNSCGADTVWHTLRVYTRPAAGAIVFATDTLCIGTSITLSDTGSSATGTWLATNDNATISAAKLTGVSAGRDTLFYIVFNDCGADTTQADQIIAGPPLRPSITGNTFVCIERQKDTLTASPTGSGGIWTATNDNVVVSEYGVVTANAIGQDTVIYTRYNVCGDSSASLMLTVPDGWTCDSISGVKTVVQSSELIVYPNPADELLTVRNCKNYSRILIITLLGETAISIPVTDDVMTLCVGNLTAGMYELQAVSLSGTVYVERFIKN